MLSSDSSIKYFPENNVSHFFTLLPTPVELRGDWEESLAEFMYTNIQYYVNSSNNYVRLDLNNGKILVRRILPGFYESTLTILKAITIKDHENKIFLTAL